MSTIFDDLPSTPNGFAASARLAVAVSEGLRNGKSIEDVRRRAGVGSEPARAAMRAGHAAILAAAESSLMGNAAGAAAALDRRGWLDVELIERWNAAEDAGEVPADLRRDGKDAWARVMRLLDRAEKAAAKAPAPPARGRVVETGL